MALETEVSRHRVRLGKHRRRFGLGRPFARLWTGFTLTSSGDGLVSGAIPLLAVIVDPHPLAVSTVVAADSLPWLLMALPAGALADRFDRGPVMALANILRAAAILLAALLVLSGRMGFWLLIAVVLVNAAARAFYYTSLQAMVPGLVEPEALERANGVLNGTQAGTEHLAGPVVGTALFAWSQAVPFLADAVALALSCFPFVRLRKKAKAPRPPGSSTSMWEGARLIFADRRLRLLLFMVTSLAGLQGLETGVLVLLATSEWGIRTGAYGLFLAAGAAGYLIGSVIADSQVRRFGSARTLVAAGLVSGAGYLVMAAARAWPVATPAYVLVGLAVGAGSVASISLRQRLTPDDLMGRVSGAWSGIVWGAAPAGALAAGTLAAYAGLRAPVLLAGVLQCAVALFLARPILRTIGGDRPGLEGPAPTTAG